MTKQTTEEKIAKMIRYARPCIESIFNEERKKEIRDHVEKNGNAALRYYFGNEPNSFFLEQAWFFIYEDTTTEEVRSECLAALKELVNEVGKGVFEVHKLEYEKVDDVHPCITFYMTEYSSGNVTMLFHDEDEIIEIFIKDRLCSGRIDATTHILFDYEKYDNELEFETCLETADKNSDRSFSIDCEHRHSIDGKLFDMVMMIEVLQKHTSVSPERNILRVDINEEDDEMYIKLVFIPWDDRNVTLTYQLCNGNGEFTEGSEHVLNDWFVGKRQVTVKYFGEYLENKLHL